MALQPVAVTQLFTKKIN